MTKLERILVPVDFEACSRAGLEYAYQLASVTGASIDVLHVWLLEPFGGPGMAIALGAGKITELEETAKRETGLRLAEFVGKMPAPPGVRVTSSVTYGVPYETILARAPDYDLIVMGTHGRGPIGRFFLGSVTEKVIRGSLRPVLVVRAVGNPAHV